MVRLQEKRLIIILKRIYEVVEPDLIYTVLNKNDILVICSDGLTNMVREEKIFDIIKENADEDVTDVLVDEANNAGGLDNITVIVIDNR